LDPSQAGDIKDPDQATLAKFYKDNLASFERPEQRQITLLHISAKSLAAGVEVKEDEIKRVYDNRKSVYVVKEKRRFEQIRFKDEAAATDGAARLARGESFETVATLQGMKPAEIKIGEATEGDPSIPADAFKVAANIPTAALKGPFGWVILRATEITPGSIKTLDDVRTEIKDAIALEKAKGRVFELSNMVEDTLGAGATMEEAVKKDPILALRGIPALTQAGKGAAGEVIDNLPADPEFMSQVFSTEQGRETSVNSDGEGGQYIVRVDKITAKAAPPLDTIRDEVLARWRDQAIETKLKALATSVVQRGEKGESLKMIGGTLGIAPLTAPDLARTSMNEIFSEQMIDKIFEAKLGGFVSGPVGNGKSHIVARFERAEVNTDPSEAQITPMFNERLRQSLAADIAQTFTQYARTDLGVREPDPARWKLLVDSN
jgi:peptidyl-prolyl cis-trans isomerase D